MSLEDSFFCEDEDEACAGEVLMAGPSGLGTNKDSNMSEASGSSVKVKKELFQGTNEGVSLAKTFSNNVLADPNTCPSSSGIGGSDAAQEQRIRMEASENNDNGKIISIV